MKKSIIYRNETGGYALHHIPGIVCLPDQSLLAYCEARRIREWGDWADIDILMRRSSDGGESWMPRQHLAGIPGQTTNNPVAIVNRVRGTVHFLYNVNYYRCYHIWSQDGGRTFSNPVDITYVLERIQKEHPFNLAAFGPGHGIQLKNGRLIVPFWLGLGSKKFGGSPRAISHENTFTGVIWSDDHGDTWEHTALTAMNIPEYGTPNEAQIVELEDGALMMNIRTGHIGNRRLVSISRDGGESWEKPYFDENLFDPICFAGFYKMPDRDMLLFSNPDSSILNPAPGWSPRCNLTLRASRDGGKSWPWRKVVETGGGGYSDIATDAAGNVYCLYGGGDPEKPEMPIGTITLVKLSLNEIVEE